MNNMLKEKTPWGPWATIGFALLIGVVVTIAQIIGMVAYLVVQKASDPSLEIRNVIRGLENNGLFLSISTLISFSISVGLILFFCRIRRDMRIQDYLAIRWTGTKTTLICIGIMVAVAAVTDGISLLMGRPIVPEFMTSSYRSASSLPLLLVVICGLAPIGEELFFRGFLYKGLACSRLGVPGTIVLTSLGWAILHLQYDVYGIVIILIAGLIMGTVRARTRSIVPVILMHVSINVMATIETMIVVAIG